MSSSPDPNNPTVFEAQIAKPRPSRRSNRTVLLIICFIFGLLCAPLIIRWLPTEAARWRIAAAEEQRLNGDLDGAIRSLDSALAEFEDSSVLYWKRALYFAKAERYEEAIEDLDRAEVAGYRPDRLLPQRSTMLHHLGRHDEAIKNSKELLQLGEDDIRLRISALNGLAYAQALGNVELKDALKNVDEAIRLGGENAAMLDTRGFVRYLLEDYDAALEDMNKAVVIVEAIYAESAVSDLLPDQRVYDAERREMNQTIAVLRYHRALVHDKLLNGEKATADRKRVRELGFEPNPGLF